MLSVSMGELTKYPDIESLYTTNGEKKYCKLCGEEDEDHLDDCLGILLSYITPVIQIYVEREHSNGCSRQYEIHSISQKELNNWDSLKEKTKNLFDYSRNWNSRFSKDVEPKIRKNDLAELGIQIEFAKFDCKFTENIMNKIYIEDMDEWKMHTHNRKIENIKNEYSKRVKWLEINKAMLKEEYYIEELEKAKLDCESAIEAEKTNK